MYTLSDYSYELPEHLIAQEATHPHHDARMMVVDRATGEKVTDSTFWELGEFLGDDRVLFFNNSRVIPARVRLHDVPFETREGHKGIIHSGEILFCQRLPDDSFEALVRPGKKFRIGTMIYFPEGKLEVIEETDTGRILKGDGVDIVSLMQKYGELPLPPYISYTREKEADYQTAFALKDGSVAAPTASLHFTPELLDCLPHERHSVTLHVGLGTFHPLDTPDIRSYAIHSEMVEIELSLFETIASLKQNDKKIVAIGTTVCRTLESLPLLWKFLDTDIFPLGVREYWEKKASYRSSDRYITGVSCDKEGGIVRFSTSIYIYPGYDFLLVDDLITNFHLPESSLLVLVSTFLGREKTLALYRDAIENGYRFFSFGDGMYIRG